MVDFLSSRKFLATYSGVLTIVFAITVLCAAKQHVSNGVFDQITVHRINVVEPDGVPRLILSDQAEFPGSFFRGREISRPDRIAAGMLFLDNEGTEDGGLIFGGLKGKDGKIESYGHLSFDQYDQDQTLALDSSYADGMRRSGISINDAARNFLTPEVFAEREKIRAMPEGPAKKAAWQTFMSTYGLTRRAFLGRENDKSVGLKLRDAKGNVRAALLVQPDGTPVLEFMDANGKVTRNLSGEKP